MNTKQEIKNMWTKISGDQEEMVTVQEFLDEQVTTAQASPEEIVSTINSLKNEALKLGETPLGLKYYTEAKLMETTALPLVNETVSAEIENRMIELQRKAVNLTGAAMKKLLMERKKQLEEMQLVNKSLIKASGGLRGIKKVFKKIGKEQNKLFDIVGTVSFSQGTKMDKEILETATKQWRTDLAKLNSQELTSQAKQ